MLHVACRRSRYVYRKNLHINIHKNKRHLPTFGRLSKKINQYTKHPEFCCAFMRVVYSDPHCQPPQIIPTATDAFSEPIPTIDALYSPKFPLEVVREFVMEALLEAVEVNQVHNRDPIGWSNENLFL